MQPALALVPMPLWVDQAAPGDPRRIARLRFLLDLCALYGTPDGRMTTLSMRCGFSPSAIGKAKHLGAVSPEMAIEIERCLGRGWITREVLLPEMFKAEG